PADCSTFITPADVFIPSLAGFSDGSIVIVPSFSPKNSVSGPSHSKSNPSAKTGTTNSNSQSPFPGSGFGSGSTYAEGGGISSSISHETVKINIPKKRKVVRMGYLSEGNL